MTSQKTNIVIIASLGSSDIKLWFVNEKGKAEAGLGNKGYNPRPLHDLLLQPSSSYQFYNTPEGLDVQTLLSLEEKDQLLAEIRQGNNPLHNQEPLKLCPGKLGNLVNQVLAEKKKYGFTIARVMVFATDRRDVEKCQYAKQEPVAAGPLISKWLANAFDLEYIDYDKLPEDDSHYATWVNFLSGLCDFTGKERENQPLHRVACNHILRAVTKVRHGLDQPRLMLSDTGGIGEAKLFINAAARLHFAPEVYETREAEGHTLEWRYELDFTRPSQAETILARSHCRQRLLQGDIEGAWGSVAHMQHLAKDLSWLPRVKELMDYIQGQRIEHPTLNTVAKLQQFTLQGPALRQAFKAEAALQAPSSSDRRIAEALLATATLAELSVEVMVKLRLQQLPGEALQTAPLGLACQLLDADRGRVKLLCPPGLTPFEHSPKSDSYNDNKAELCYTLKVEDEGGAYWRQLLSAPNSSGEILLKEIIKFLESAPGEENNSERKSIKSSMRLHPTKDSLVQIKTGVKPCEDSGSTYELNFRGENRQFWIDTLAHHSSNPSLSPKSFKTRLDEHSRSYETRSMQTMSLTNFRNALAHRSLNQTNLAAIYDLATENLSKGKNNKVQQLPLWQQPSSPELGQCFLSAPLCQQFFQELGISKVEILYQELFHEVINALLDEFPLCTESN